MAVFYLITTLVSLAMLITLVVALWKVYTKMGEAGWACLVPFYSNYVMLRRVWDTKLFWPLTIGGILPSILLKCGGSENMVTTLISLPISIAVLVIMIMMYVKLAKAFGKGNGFAVGMVLLMPIFICILGFGDAEYTDPNKAYDADYVGNDYPQNCGE